MSRRWWLPLALAACAGFLPGCLVVQRTRDQPGSDPQVLAPAGLDRTAIEQALGPPLRDWRPNNRVRYAQYVFHETVKADAGAAGALAFMDVITLGMLEVMAAAAPGKEFSPDSGMPYRLIWVGFDGAGNALGVFEEFAGLPDELPVGEPKATPR
jgi:hypothetical protein